jgi:hypothetical protein
MRPQPSTGKNTETLSEGPDLVRAFCFPSCTFVTFVVEGSEVHSPRRARRYTKEPQELSQFIDLPFLLCENPRKRLILRGQERGCLRSVPIPRVLADR